MALRSPGKSGDERRGLKITGVLGDAPIPPAKLDIQVYLPDRNDPEAKLILPNLKAGEAECLPEGAYHVVSKLMDVTPGAARRRPTRPSTAICACRREN